MTKAIYKITNIIDHKIYVGQHLVNKYYDDPIKDNYKGSGLILKRIKQKYNWYEDFKFEIIEFCKNSAELNEREIYWIEYYKNIYGKLCCNIATGGRGGASTGDSVRKAIASNREKYHQIWKKSSEQKSKRVLVVFDFVSPLNNKVFAAGTIFKSAFDASTQIGYSSKTSMAVLMSRKYHPGQWYLKQKGARWGYDFVTAFQYINNDYCPSQLIDIQRYHRSIENKFYDSLATTTIQKVNKSAQTVARKVVCMSSFTSPLNHKHFKKGTTFESIMLCSEAVGFKQNALNNVMRHPKHKGDWYNGYGNQRQYIASFAYVDELTDDQKQQLAIQ